MLIFPEGMNKCR